MKFFDKLEKKLEKFIEGNILGRFGGKLQPVEIARAIWLVVTAKKVREKGREYIPNFYTVSLAQEDYNNLLKIREEIEEEIIEFIRFEARERDFRFSGPPVIQWVQNPGVKCGASQISAEFAKSSELPLEIKRKVETKTELKLPGACKQLLKMDEVEGDNQENTDNHNSPNSIEKTGEFEETLIKELIPVFTVVEGFEKGKIYTLTKNEYVIGRAEDCDICIGDPAVSRRHAKLEADVKKQGKDYILIDTNSGAGTRVNGRKISTIALKTDDLVQMGYTTFKYLKILS
jgi:hypothetical protein